MAISVERLTVLKKLQQLLEVSFKNQELLNNAFAHRSYVKEQKNEAVLDNERLEFLGDAVLKLIISEHLFSAYPQQTEGYLSKIRSMVVSDETLAQIALDNKLGDFLLLSKNEKLNGGAVRKSNVANMMEALFGACFLDQGLDCVRALIIKLIGPTINEIVSTSYNRDYKSLLQETVQSLGWKLPEYRVIQETGPEHEKVFCVQVKVGKGLKKYKETGSGKTKKEAEQNAAQKVLELVKSGE